MIFYMFVVDIRLVKCIAIAYHAKPLLRMTTVRSAFLRLMIMQKNMTKNRSFIINTYIAEIMC